MRLPKALKSGLGRTLFSVFGSRRLVGDRGCIVLFHRVDDRAAGDPISCGVAEFRAYCEYFKKHFDVVSLAEMSRRIAAREPIRNQLAITFDDGYLDNARVAAPILQELALPATFFVVTDFIGSRMVPWWDANLPFRPDWMSWDDVRSLHRAGFGIGAHTKTHVDLGTCDLETADREIRGSKERIETEIGHPVTMFSYPYGRRDSIRPDTLDLVRKAGFQLCCSAYGGIASPTDDLFQLRRQSVSPWFISPDHLGFEIMAHCWRKQPVDLAVEWSGGTPAAATGKSAA